MKTPKRHHNYATKYLLYEILLILKQLPKLISDKIHTHSLNGVNNYYKYVIINGMVIITNVPPNVAIFVAIIVNDMK